MTATSERRAQPELAQERGRALSREYELGELRTHLRHERPSGQATAGSALLVLAMIIGVSSLLAVFGLRSAAPLGVLVAALPGVAGAVPSPASATGPGWSAGTARCWCPPRPGRSSCCCPARPSRRLAAGTLAVVVISRLTRDDTQPTRRVIE